MNRQNEIIIQEIPAQVKYMEFNDSIAEIINSENEKNPRLNFERNEIIKETNEEKEMRKNENFQIEENINANYDNDFNNNMEINNSNERYYLKEIYDNDNYMNEKEIEEESREKEYRNMNNMKYNDNYNNKIINQFNGNKYLNDRQRMQMEKANFKMQNNMHQYKFNTNNNINEYNEISHEDQSVFINDKSPRYNKNKNLNDSNRNSKSPGIVRETKNYQLFSSHYSKTGKNVYVPKNYIGSEKTTFMEKANKYIERANKNNKSSGNDAEKIEMKKEMKPEIIEEMLKVSKNTKIVDAIPIEKYIQNNKETNEDNKKIFITIDPKENYAKSQNNFGVIKNQNENQTFNPIKMKNGSINMNKNQANNINYSNNEAYPILENINMEKQIKKKRKRIIYYRRHKPIVIQHFDVQIIQQQQRRFENFQNNIYKENKNKYEDKNIHYNKKNITKEKEEKNKVPSLQSLYRNMSNYNRNPNYYFNNSIPMPLSPYFNKENINRYRKPFTPKQTLINVTTMRTMNERFSPYTHNMKIPYNRYYRSNNFGGFIPLTPPNHFRRQYEYENNESYFNNEGNIDDMRGKSLYLYYPQRKDPSLIYEDAERGINDENSFPQYQYNRGQRIKRNNY